MKAKNKGLTLVELLFSSLLITIIIFATGSGFLFAIRSTQTNLERAHMELLIDNMLQNIRLHAMGASSLPDTYEFQINNLEEYDAMAELRFRADKDPYDITPNDSTDDVLYRYHKSGKAFLLNKYGDTPEEIVLIPEKYNANISFRHYNADEPNLLTVHFELNQPTFQVTKDAVVRFWYTTIMGDE